jgi:hypothetical protein
VLPKEKPLAHKAGVTVTVKVLLASVNETIRDPKDEQPPEFNPFSTAKLGVLEEFGQFGILLVIPLPELPTSFLRIANAGRELKRQRNTTARSPRLALGITGQSSHYFLICLPGGGRRVTFSKAILAISGFLSIPPVGLRSGLDPGGFLGEKMESEAVGFLLQCGKIVAELGRFLVSNLQSRQCQSGFQGNIVETRIPCL